ncbi:MAG: hypothetical protein AABW81_02305 [Nanoarchaeota archaeon]
MGSVKYRQDVERLFAKSAIVSNASISRIIGKKKNKNYTKRMINYLIEKNIIRRITKGYYTNKEDNLISVLCFQPAYLGLQDALSFHNLWEQETIPVIVTSRNIRTGIRKILKKNVMLRKINEKYFFGYDYHQYNNIAIPYSDIEKTFIDLVYFKENIDKEVLKNIKKKINRKKLNNYLKIYPLRFRKIIGKYWE